MQVGVMIPQGWKYEYNGWDPATAWARTLDLARHAEEIGFESEWVFDHFHTVPDPLDEITFESFTTITALAMVTRRVRLGHWSSAPASAIPPWWPSSPPPSTSSAAAGSRSGSAAAGRRTSGWPTATGSRPSPSASAACATPWRSSLACSLPGTPRIRASTPVSRTRSTTRRASRSRARRSSSAATDRT